MAKKVYNPMDVYAGLRVRTRRMMLGKSQGWLGDSIGVTFQQIQKYEKGMNGMRTSRVQQVANVLGVTPDYFFEGMPGAHGTSQGMVQPDFITKELATKDGLALITAFHDLSHKHRTMVLGLAENLGTR